MINIIIPLIVLVIIIYGFIKKIEIYERFVDGVIEGLKTVYNIFPSIFAMNFCINILLSSNFINDLISNICINSDLLSISIMRPISGSSSLIILENILLNNGPDSFIGRVSSVLQGSTDTTIYILGLYFSSVGIKKTKYALLVGLLTDFMAIIISYIIVSILF